MKISIVVPIFNCEKYLGACIESVTNQSSFDWELILVNDGSTDKSAEICNSYADKYPDKIFAFHKENEGQFLTRKFGILKSSGDYIGFLDADDLLDKDYVKTLSEIIRKYETPDTICFGFSQFGDNFAKEYKISESTVYFKTPDERKSVYKMIVSGQLPGSLWSKVFKKDIISNNIPDEKIVRTKRFAEDAYHSFDALAKSNSIIFIDQTLYNYRNNEQGFSQGFETRALDYFNSKFLFQLIENNLMLMEIDSQKIRNSLYERNFNETVYYMMKYFRASKNTKRKKEIIDFDWSSYLLDGTIELIKNKYEFKKSYLNIWEAFKNKKYFEIILREKFKKIIGW